MLDGGYSFYYSTIEGFDEFAAGEADSISGLEAPDDSTLVVRTSAPTGDLPFRMAMPAAAPIPPLPGDPDARFGVATGHDDNYGRFLIGTGPYMFEGTDQLDFSLPPEDQDPVTGYDVGRSIVLVRNPSYDPDSDDLREGYVDRIEVVIGGDSNDLALKVDAGELDMVYDGVPPAAQIRQYASDPELQDQIHSDPSDAVRYIEMNLANPPFDDPNVRIALNYALDKEGFRQLRGGPLFGELAGHIMVNSLQGPAEGLRPLPDTERTRGRDGGQGGHGRVRIRHGRRRRVRRPVVSGHRHDHRRGRSVPEADRAAAADPRAARHHARREDVRAHDDVFQVRGPELPLGPVPQRVLGQGLPGRFVRPPAVQPGRDRTRVVLQRPDGGSDPRHPAGSRLRSLDPDPQRGRTDRRVHPSPAISVSSAGRSSIAT